MENNTFILATDGWVQVTPCGEFPHVGAGVVQVIDRAACDAMAADFNVRKSDANFPGVLVDFDHFSLDTGQSSEAAGWITELESRDTGLWARVRWSDAGLLAVQGGRFRLMSPVFPPPSACEDLGGGKIRPVMLVSVALTNEPNIKGGRPIANRQSAIGKGEAPDGAPRMGRMMRM
jgi:phage I-like protein